MATTSISGTSIASASIKIYANGTEIVSAATTASSIGYWTATIPVQPIGTKITAKAILGSNSISIASNEITVTAVTPVDSGGGGGSITTPTPPVTASPITNSMNYLLILVVLFVIIAVFLFIKKKTKIAIGLLLVAGAIFAVSSTKK